MQLFLTFVALAAPSFGAVMIQQSISCSSEKEIAPQWESRNGLALVPLNKTARSGLVDPVTEEGAIYALGPRFANPFLSNITSDGDLGSCWPCLGTVVKETPCVIKAIKDENPSELLDCGIDKADICKCVDCLPDAIKNFVEGWCNSKRDVGTKATKGKSLAYVDLPLVAEHDLNLAAFRGGLATYRLDEVKSLGICPGSSCGSCGCCIGYCIPFVNTCAGACVPL